jgi:hypothetical protein
VEFGIIRAVVEISYQLTEDDYRQGYKGFRNRTAISRWSIRIGRAFFVLLLASAFLLSFRGRDKSFSNLFPLWGLLAFWAWTIWGCPYYIARKMMKGSRNAPLPRILNVSDSGLYDRTSNAESKFTWDLIVGWVEVERVFSLFLSPISYYPVPKRAMTDSQQHEFRTLLRAKISTTIKPK